MYKRSKKSKAPRFPIGTEHVQNAAKEKIDNALGESQHYRLMRLKKSFRLVATPNHASLMAPSLTLRFVGKYLIRS